MARGAACIPLCRQSTPVLYNRPILSVEDRMRQALTAGSEELWQFVRDAHPAVISNVLLNRHLTEEMAVYIAKKKTVPAEALGFLAQDVRFKDSYKLKFSLCKNPGTSQRVTFSLLKFLRIFDLAEIARDQRVPIAVRQKIEHLMAERIPSMPLGVKTALARRCHSNILLLLLETGEEGVIRVCLDSPALTEAFIYRIINRPSTVAGVIRLIAGHAKWSLGYNIRFGLIRNFHTPMAAVLKFVGGMKTVDLRDLYADPKLPSATRHFIFSELCERGESVEKREDEAYELSEDEEDVPPAIQ